MEVKSTDKKTFFLTDNGQELGQIIYENPFLLKAEINLVASSKKYNIAPVGFFGTSIDVTENGVQIAKLVWNWKGQIVVTFENEKEYVVKLNSFFSNKYIIENKDREQLVQLESKFSWKDFQYNYDINYNIHEDKTEENILLLLLGVYSANFFIATMSGANAGMM